jgi:hypothetical protein
MQRVFVDIPSLPSLVTASRVVCTLCVLPVSCSMVSVDIPSLSTLVSASHVCILHALPVVLYWCHCHVI